MFLSHIVSNKFASAPPPSPVTYPRVQQLEVDLRYDMGTNSYAQV